MSHIFLSFHCKLTGIYVVVQDISSSKDVQCELQSLFSNMFSREVMESDEVMQSCMSPSMAIPLAVILEASLQ